MARHKHEWPNLLASRKQTIFLSNDVREIRRFTKRFRLIIDNLLSTACSVSDSSRTNERPNGKNKKKRKTVKLRIIGRNGDKWWGMILSRLRHFPGLKANPQASYYRLIVFDLSYIPHRVGRLMNIHEIYLNPLTHQERSFMLHFQLCNI